MTARCPKCGLAFPETGIIDPEGEPPAVCRRCGTVLAGGFDLDPNILKDMEVQGLPKGPAADLHVRHRQYKRYLILLLILLAVVIGYQLSEAFLKTNALNASRDVVAQRQLKQLAVAQEAYYMDHSAYTDQLEDLAGLFTSKPAVHITIDRADQRVWSAKAYHQQSPHAFRFDSDNGGLDINPVPRDESIK